MTPEYKHLREAMAEALWQAESVRVAGKRRKVPWSESVARDQWLPLADAAIALAFEEAANVCERRYNTREDMEARRCADAIMALVATGSHSAD